MVIKIKNLKSNIIIGTLEHERVTPQLIEIDIEFEYDTTHAIENDDFNHAVDYKVLTEEILTYLQDTKFYLIETLLSNVIEKLREIKQISFGKVVIRKPKALKDAEYVSVEGTF